jgi:transitional endoplasmic reticulum ATPase
MSINNDEIEPLREALRFSPNNIPLRLHIATLLLNKGRLDESETEYREALVIAPHNQQLKLGLSDVFFRQNKLSAALVIIEDIIKSPDIPARAHLLYSQLLLKTGEVEKAIQKYKLALKNDSSLADIELEEKLGLNFADDYEEVVDGRIRVPMGEPPTTREDTLLERPSINFSDVGGMDKLKEDIKMKIIHPLTHADMYKAYGKTIGGGILMYGPPGCGKTYLARATAGEIQARFVSVGINDVLDMWMGQSERNLHDLFASARENNPCVLFFDEVDALGASRTDMRQSSGRHLINQFLSELDGVKDSNDGVLILAATNAPWHIDSAFRRPGRFDRILFVPPPDAPARASILKILLKGKPVKEIDYEIIAKKTDFYSGADLKAIIDITVEEKLKEAMKKGVPEPITTKDLLAALKNHKPTTKEWFNTARNYALYSNQGGIYDDILAYLKLL